MLIVDDDAEVLALLAEDLATDYDCLTAEDGAHALAQLAAHPDVALLVSDIRMPGMSGVQLARAVVARWPAVRVLLITGYAAPNGHCFRVLHKPFRLHVLHQAARDALAA